MVHFGHDDYILNVPYGVLRLLKVKQMGWGGMDWIDLAKDRD
jgi:hypothetical protein